MESVRSRTAVHSPFFNCPPKLACQACARGASAVLHSCWVCTCSLSHVLVTESCGHSTELDLPPQQSCPALPDVYLRVYTLRTVKAKLLACSTVSARNCAIYLILWQGSACALRPTYTRACSLAMIDRSHTARRADSVYVACDGRWILGCHVRCAHQLSGAYVRFVRFVRTVPAPRCLLAPVLHI